MDDPAIEKEGTREALTKRLDVKWLAACGVITLVAAWLRFYDLGLKPLHHDEGVNGFFLTTLFRDGIYKYDPANYHGPTLYYIALLLAKVFGLETVPVRASVAIFGVLTVVLTFYLWRYIGRVGSLAAGLLIALSPGMVFISRYFIHESLFVFLSLAIVVAILFFIEKQRAGPLAIFWTVVLLLTAFLPSTLNLASMLGGGTATQWAVRLVIVAIEAALIFVIVRMLLAWQGGRPVYFLLASASTVLLFATKETAAITIGVMLIACVCVWIWRKIFPSMFGKLGPDELSEGDLTWSRFRGALGTSTDLVLILIAAAAIFIYLGVLFFSSFFSYPDGVKGAPNSRRVLAPWVSAAS
jgi:predicted membrane-bound mannosyltransferase